MHAYMYMYKPSKQEKKATSSKFEASQVCADNVKVFRRFISFAGSKQ